MKQIARAGVFSVFFAVVAAPGANAVEVEAGATYNGECVDPLYEGAVSPVGGPANSIVPAFLMYAPPVDYDGTFTVRWTDVKNFYNSPLYQGFSRYRLEMASSPEFLDVTVKYEGYGTSAVISGLSRGTYYFRAYALYACAANNPTCSSEAWFGEGEQLSYVGPRIGLRNPTHVSTAYATTDVRNADENVIEQPADGFQDVQTLPIMYAPPYDDNGTFEITWSNLKYFFHYTAEIARKPDFSDAQALSIGSAVGTVRRAYVSGLAPGTYYFRVSADYYIPFGPPARVNFVGPYITTVSPENAADEIGSELP